MQGMCGGWSESHDKTAEIQTLAEQVKSDAEIKTGKTFSQYEVQSYSQQVVAGMNYFVKVKVGDNDYIHLKIFQGLPHTGSAVSLSEVHEGKSATDPFH